MRVDRKKYYWGRLISLYRRGYKKVLKKEAPYHKLNGQKVITKPSELNHYLSQMINTDKSFMVGRYGSVELSAMNSYLDKVMGKTQKYPDRVLNHLYFNAGFFPVDEDSVDRFAELMIESAAQLDILGLWNNKMELFFAESYSSKTIGAELYCLEPYYDLSTSWTHALKGKRVLVVHPFEETIKEQFLKKEMLFDSEFWPECQLITFKAVQTIAGEKDDRFDTWFSALEYMKDQISQINFDIAILGCGAYGFPLAAAIKQMGKKAIHLGGATQLLFGIRANRWEKSEVSSYFNQFWVRPKTSEKPTNANKIENGCYW